jgi:hypothetical protein
LVLQGHFAAQSFALSQHGAGAGLQHRNQLYHPTPTGRAMAARRPCDHVPMSPRRPPASSTTPSIS